MPLPQSDHKHKPIPISEFGTHVTMLHENSNQGFKAKYDVSWLNLVTLVILMLHLILQSFYNGEGMSTAIGRAAANKHKNRFANIAACKFS